MSLDATHDLTVDAATTGNEGRFINDYRGIGERNNVELRFADHLGGPNTASVQPVEVGPPCMSIWTVARGIPAGDELLLSYGKGYWQARAGRGAADFVDAVDLAVADGSLAGMKGGEAAEASLHRTK
jgi:SET domain-containing protein